MSPEIWKVLNPGLAVVFAIHAAAFAWLYLRRGRVKYALLVGTFVCLTLIYIFRTLQWQARSVSLGLRVLAIAFTLAAILLRKR